MRIALILILCIALFLRLHSLGEPALWIDETISAIASKNIAEGKGPNFDSGVHYNRAYFYHHTEAFFLLFGQTDANARLASVIFGMLAVVLAFVIGKEYSRTAGIAAALLVSVFYLQVFYSRQGRFYQLFQLAFFLTLYLLYKSKKKDWLLYPAMLAFIIAVDTQPAGLILAPFMIAFIIYYKRAFWPLIIIPAIIFVWKLLPLLGLTQGSDIAGISGSYAGAFSGIWYLIILFHIGLIIAWKKNRLLTALMALPSLCLFLGILAINQFATRYAFFLAFLFLLYTGVLIGFLNKRIGNWSYVALAALVIIPSNLIDPLTFTTILKPVDYNLNDPTAPTVDMKSIPAEVKEQVRNSTSIAFFSPAMEWYIAKPDHIIPFSMSGMGNDTISRDGRDIYSGAPTTESRPQGNYTLIADEFAISKLKPYQKDLLANLTTACKELYKNPTLTVYGC